MSGVKVLYALLSSNANLLAQVPVARMYSGVIPQGTATTCLAIHSISAWDLNIPQPTAKKRVSERVQVTVLAADYPTLKTVLDLVRRAARDYVGSIAGLSEVTVHTDGQGPDFISADTGLHLQAQDFLVRFNE